MTHPRLALGLILLASALILATVWASQLWGGLSPCELCLYERWAYYAALVVALLGLASRGSGRAALWLIALIFLASSGLGAYHVAVEQHWIAGPTACTGGIGQASSPEALLQMLEHRQTVQCDVVQWSFHGLSLAGLNLIASLLLFVYALSAARQRRRR